MRFPHHTRLQGPSAKHFFGTDNLGRDIYARIVYAARTTLSSAVVVVLLAACIGIIVGSLAGYSGKIVDEILMRIVALFMAFPLLVLAMAIVAALGPGLQNAMAALIIIWWTQYARLTRGLVLQIREREFVTAAQAIGASRTKILYRHILPNCFSPLLVKVTLDIAVAVLVTASLSFLGLGVQPPDPDWGNMVSDGRQFVQDAWWYPTFPGLAIFVTVMSLNLIGDAVRDLLDPRLRQ
jgi:peptide/nickel transport system permease protein